MNLKEVHLVIVFTAFIWIFFDPDFHKQSNLRGEGRVRVSVLNFKNKPFHISQGLPNWTRPSSFWEIMCLKDNWTVLLSSYYFAYLTRVFLICSIYVAQIMKFSIKDFFSKFNQIRRKLCSDIIAIQPLGEWKSELRYYFYDREIPEPKPFLF